MVNRPIGKFHMVFIVWKLIIDYITLFPLFFYSGLLALGVRVTQKFLFYIFSFLKLFSFVKKCTMYSSSISLIMHVPTLLTQFEIISFWPTMSVCFSHERWGTRTCSLKLYELPTQSKSKWYLSLYNSSKQNAKSWNKVVFVYGQADRFIIHSYYRIL